MFMYECKVIISDEDVERLLTKHGFEKNKRSWLVKGSDNTRLSTQEALQMIVISAATRELEREVEPSYLKDYAEAVIKFDSCRGCLARITEKLGLSVNPPDYFKGDWYMWLIKQLDTFKNH